MSSLSRLLPPGRRLPLVDAALLGWTVAWVIVAFNVATEVRGLSDLSETVTRTGVAVDESGRALQGLAGVPLVGDRVSEPAARIREAGASAVESGRSSRESVRRLSWLLGLAIALIPTVPLVAIYLPIRVIRERERRALRDFLRAGAGDPGFERFLVRRAQENLPYRSLRRLSRRPWLERDEAELTRAELGRLGLGKETHPMAVSR